MKKQTPRFYKSAAPTFAIVAVAITQAVFASTTVTVPNASFESPNVTGISPYFTQFTLSSTPIIGTWVRYGTGSFAAAVEGGRYGVSPSGLDGTQFSDQSARAGTGVFQDIAPYDGSGLANQYWQADMMYSFTVGVFSRSDNPVVGTDRLDIKLYSRTSISAPADVHGGVSVLGSAVATGSLTDFTFTYTTLASDPFIGKPIGIWFDSVSGVSKDWGYDNVRLSFAPVPEVSSLASGALGSLLFLRRRR
jgi:hypothetical protein